MSPGERASVHKGGTHHPMPWRPSGFSATMGSRMPCSCLPMPLPATQPLFASTARATASPRPRRPPAHPPTHETPTSTSATSPPHFRENAQGSAGTATVAVTHQTHTRCHTSRHMHAHTRAHTHTHTHTHAHTHRQVVTGRHSKAGAATYGAYAGERRRRVVWRAGDGRRPAPPPPRSPRRSPTAPCTL